MAIALNAITDAEEVRAPANPLAVKGNIVATRQCKVPIPASTTAETLDLPIKLEPGTVVVGAIIDTPTTFGATATLSLKTKTAGVVFVAAANVETVGGQQMTIAANKGVVVPTTVSAEDTVQLILAAAASPASDLDVYVTLITASIKPVTNVETFNT